MSASEFASASRGVSADHREVRGGGPSVDPEGAGAVYSLLEAAKGAAGIREVFGSRIDGTGEQHILRRRRGVSQLVLERHDLLALQGDLVLVELERCGQFCKFVEF